MRLRLRRVSRAWFSCVFACFGWASAARGEEAALVEGDHPTSTATIADTATTTPPIEIVVRARRTPGGTSLARAEIRELPGAFGDATRAVEVLPGVSPLTSGLPYFFVRGAPPGNVGYFIDGVRVPYLYHLAFGPSVLPPAFVDSADLHRGGYPARWGRFAGGILSTQSAEPDPEWKAEAALRLVDAGALVQGGFDDGQGTVLLGGRYSYSAALLSLVSPEISLDYRDYQARLTYELTKRDQVSVFAFGAYDLLAEDQTDGTTAVLFASEFYRADLRYDRRLDEGKLRAGVVLGYDRSSISPLSGEQRYVVDRSAAARFELHLTPSDDLRVSAGADAAVDEYRVEPSRYSDPEDPRTREFEELFPRRTNFTSGAWCELALDVDPQLRLSPGLRVDLYRERGKTLAAIEPRMAATYAVLEELDLITTFGISHQPPSFPLPIPGLTPVQRDPELQRSIQSSFGFELDLPRWVLVNLTLFHNAFFNLTDPLAGTMDGDEPDLFERLGGSALGMELSVKLRLTDQLNGFATYTLARSTRSVGDEKFPSAFDRTHVANVAAAYNFGSGWSAGARVTFYTGTPHRPEPVFNDVTPPRTTRVERAPPFFRLDVRGEKRWSLGSSGWISLVLEVMNATLSREKFSPDDEGVGPIVIPSLGAEAGF